MKKVIASHLIRASTHFAHGGLFVVDVETGKYDKVFDWDEDIDHTGRAGDRGLRGISVYNDRIYVASANSLLIFNKDFKLLNRINNPYLGACHETMIFKDKLYIVSTGFDSIIVYDIKKEKFSHGCLIRSGRLVQFDCLKPNQIKRRDSKHFNSICNFNNNIYYSGTGIKNLLKLGNKVTGFIPIPAGTHNCYIMNNNEIIMNDTRNNRIIIKNRKGVIVKSAGVLKVNCKKVVRERIAKQPFARGLVFDEKYVVGGSSPGMVSVYDRNTLKNIKNIIMSKDIRMSIHGVDILE